MARRSAVRAIGVSALVAAAVAVAVRAPGPGAHPSHARGPSAMRRHANPAARKPGSAGVAAAYGFPLRCLTITIPPGHPAYARADFNHTECGRFDGYVTAIFHRVGGDWRPVLEALGYACPVAGLPAPVQADLSVCAG
ncbi:MAG TPA: hypothetical protein VHX62_07855 [Solirubrobacteraceae bacterium]|nr:hypothetical protein [Solirubrobacteraceae bacterium]